MVKFRRIFVVYGTESKNYKTDVVEIDVKPMSVLINESIVKQFNVELFIPNEFSFTDWFVVAQPEMEKRGVTELRRCIQTFEMPVTSALRYSCISSLLRSVPRRQITLGNSQTTPF